MPKIENGSEAKRGKGSVKYEDSLEGVISQIGFDENGLVPALVQDIKSGKVLMLAYMNEESIKKTLEERVVYYYSRSRQKLWKKGETSGNIQYLKGLYCDCDKDSLLVLVEQVGAACHTGSYSCFFNPIFNLAVKEGEDAQDTPDTEKVIGELYDVISQRKHSPAQGSYTSYLFDEGLDKILKKIGEESSEVIIAAKNGAKEEMVGEISDLIYHLLVLMVSQNLTIQDVAEELERRRK